jgi:hypothetical protein
MGNDNHVVVVVVVVAAAVLSHKLCQGCKLHGNEVHIQIFC